LFVCLLIFLFYSGAFEMSYNSTSKKIGGKYLILFVAGRHKKKKKWRASRYLTFILMQLCFFKSKKSHF